MEAKNMDHNSTIFIPLPSKGKIYPLDSDNKPISEIGLRAMTGQEMNILYSPNLLKTGKAFNMLLQKCSPNCKIEINELVTGDRNALLISLRAISMGEQYEVKLMCPECTFEFESVVDISNLKLKILDVEPLEENKNLFEFAFPKLNKIAHFKLLTGKDTNEIIRIRDTKAKAGSLIEDTITLSIKRMIQTIDGSFENISKIIDSAPISDLTDFRTYSQSIEPDVDMTYEHKCPTCETEFSEILNIGADFFYVDFKKKI